MKIKKLGELYKRKTIQFFNHTFFVTTKLYKQDKIM